MNARAFAIVALIGAAGCAVQSGGESDGSAPQGGTNTGGAAAGAGVSFGGSFGEPSGGDGGAGGAGGELPVFETAVGAAVRSPGDPRVVLIDKTGTRSARFNPSTGAFEPAADIDELLGAFPLDDVAAAADVSSEVYFFDKAGSTVVFDGDRASFGPVEALSELLEGVPFATVGAAFAIGPQLFVFSAGGVDYAAFNTATGTWSAVYDFITDFGGGGAPLANVGAAITNGDAVTLFDAAGTKYCVYSISSTQFSAPFDISELGDGQLSFNDASGKQD